MTDSTRASSPADPSADTSAVPPRHRGWSGLIWLLGVLAFAWLYGSLAGVLIRTTNQEPLAQDQKNNMRLALQTRPDLHSGLQNGLVKKVTEWFPHRTDGVVAPLWPWVAAHFAGEGHEITEENFGTHSIADRHFFERGKWINVWICGAFLVGLALAVRRRFSLFGSLNLMLLAGLGALLPRAVYFQPEPLYFVLFFLCWVMACALITANSPPRYVLFGLLCGLAYLAKTSIQPLIAAWFGVMAYRFFALILPGRLRCASERWSACHHVIGTVLWAVAFLLTVGPRLDYAKKQWGQPFFAYPNVWMWMDSFDTGFQWMQQHPDAASLKAVPPDEMPSLANYRRTHTPQQMQDRLADGVWEKTHTFLAPKRAGGPTSVSPQKPWRHLLEFRGHYLGAAALLTLVVWLMTSRRTLPGDKPVSAPQDGPILLFGAGVIVASTLAYGWYSPIGRGDRFMLSLYLPLAYGLIAAAERRLSRYEATYAHTQWPRRLYRFGQFALFVALAARVAQLVHAPFFDPDVR